MPFQFPKKGDIYHVSFPQPRGPHYVVVISSNAINDNSDFLVAALITSQNANRVAPHQCRVPRGILTSPSKVKCDNVFMLPKSNLYPKDYQGSISGNDLIGLDVAICKTFDIW